MSKNTIIISEEDLCKNQYRFNFMGVPFCFYVLYNFGMELIRQVWGISMDLPIFEIISRFRYSLVVGYFAVCIFNPRYAFEFDYPEIPLLLALLADCLYLVYEFDGNKLVRSGFLVVITGGCLFLRKRSTWKILLNTWKEDVGDDGDEEEEKKKKNGEINEKNKFSV
jgi:hypothetical protein